MVFNLLWNFQQQKVFLFHQKHLFLWDSPVLHFGTQRFLTCVLGNAQRMGTKKVSGREGPEGGGFQFYVFYLLYFREQFSFHSTTVSKHWKPKLTFFHSQHIFLKYLHSPQKVGFQGYKETVNEDISPQVFAGYVVMRERNSTLFPKMSSIDKMVFV